MSVEIDEKLKQSIVKYIKKDCKPENIIVVEQVIEEVLNSEEYKAMEFFWQKDGFEQVLKNREYSRGFVSRIMFEYHKPIVQFEILLEHCIFLIKKFKYPYKTLPNTCKVLNGIAARAVLITNEILCLIKNGFASGALARWRTLYEYSVISIFLVKFGEEYAKKYLAYKDIANYKEAKVYAQHSKTLQFNDISKSELEELKKKSDDAMLNYPDLNERDYSWAKPKVKNPTFKAIVEKTDIEYYEPFYKFACNYNHGGVNGLFFDLGQIHGLSEKDSIIIAQSNFGFTDPAQLTMRALLDIISALLSLNIDTEQLFQLVFLKNKIPEIAESFHEVEKDIEEREKCFRQQIK